MAFQPDDKVVSILSKFGDVETVVKAFPKEQFGESYQALLCDVPRYNGELWRDSRDYRIAKEAEIERGHALN